MGKKRKPRRPRGSAPVGPFEPREVPKDAGPVEQMWTDREHVVLVTSASLAGDRWIHLAVRRKDGGKIRDHWRTLQKIKDLLIGKEAEAVELYPARDRLVDDGNDYHLWCPVGVRFQIGLRPTKET